LTVIDPDISAPGRGAVTVISVMVDINTLDTTVHVPSFAEDPATLKVLAAVKVDE
jgi:hypothetical protein